MSSSHFEAEKCYLEALCTPELCVKSRVLCLKGLASICNQQKDWVKARQYCEEALELLERLNVPSFDDPETRLKHHVFFLVQLGDALEGQGEWTSARQSDEQALTFWESQPRRGVYMSVLRRDGLVLIREGKLWTLANGCSRRFTSYKMQLDLGGINWTHLGEVLVAMATIKVWAEACFLTADADIITYVMSALADLAETEAIMEAYREAALVERRREAREARGMTVASAVASRGKSSKRKQQKRKAQQ
jgi:tetratricopeptide (TPR) repeat protein